MVSSTTLYGIDGCRAGWVVASADAALGGITFTVVSSFATFIAGLDPAASRVIIDIPIGLPERGMRACDSEARALLRAPRNSSVFPPPCRAALPATTYQDACDRNYRASGKRLSQQLFAIMPKIRDVDTAMTPAHQTWIREAHPEVSFAALANTGRGLLHPKKDLAGQTERLTLLRRHAATFDPHLERARLGSRVVAIDDLIDAVACLVTAQRLLQGKALILPADTIEHDSRGLRMEMVA